jgi:hypothetical protein
MQTNSLTLKRWMKSEQTPCWVVFQHIYPSNVYPVWYPALIQWVQQRSVRRLHVDPTIVVSLDHTRISHARCDAFVTIADTVPSIRAEVIRVATLAVQLAAEIDFDHPSCWSDSQAIYTGLTTVCRVDTTSFLGPTARCSMIRGIPSCWMHGVWIAIRVLVLGYTPLDLTRTRIEHNDGDVRNCRLYNLRVVRAPSCGQVRSCLITTTPRGRARLKIRIQGQVWRTPILDSDADLWVALSRVLLMAPEGWTDERNNILGYN